VKKEAYEILCLLDKFLALRRMKMKEFSLSELSKYNGKENMPAYIAYKGKVYDVSNSFL